MSQADSIIRLLRRREIDYKVTNRIQRHLHVTANLINRLGLEKTLDGHTGCVNCLEWDTKGRILASASDDFNVVIWDPFLHKKLTSIHTGHHGNIFSVKFMPQTNENVIVTGAGDYEVRVHSVIGKELTRVCVCHGGRIKRLAVAQDVPDVFWSASEDGIIRQFDLRVSHVCLRNEKNVLIDLKTYAGEYIEAKCLSVNPLRSELIAVGANDPYVRIYDRRMIKIIKGSNYNPMTHTTEDNLPSGCVQYFVPGHLPGKKKSTDRIFREFSATYVTFGPNGTDLLVNMGSEQIYLYDILSKSRSLLPSISSLRQNHNTSNIEHTNNNQVYASPLKNYCEKDSYERCPVVADTPKPCLPEHINVLKLAGNTLFEKEMYTRSIRIYNQAIGEYPQSSVMYSNRAAAYMKRDWFGDTYAALRDCITSLEFDPNNVKACFRLARCLFELAHHEEAQNCLNYFKKKFPSQAKSVACKALERDILCTLTKSDDSSEKDSTEYESVEISSKETVWREAASDYKVRFYGHCNTTTDIKEANFFGSEGQFIVAGSDDGSIFIWDLIEQVGF